MAQELAEIIRGPTFNNSVVSQFSSYICACNYDFVAVEERDGSVDRGSWSGGFCIGSDLESWEKVKEIRRGDWNQFVKSRFDSNRKRSNVSIVALSSSRSDKNISKTLPPSQNLSSRLRIHSPFVSHFLFTKLHPSNAVNINICGSGYFSLK